MPAAPRVVVAFHAHPDDESLLTGGTLAALSRQGHRVVLVVATDGARGLTAPGVVDLAARRGREVDRAAALLGVAQVVRLGYRDSGDDGAAPDGFCRVDVGEVATRLAALVVREGATLLIGYDRHGGYGHPDHVHVHHAARLAAARTGTRLLMATIDRTWLERALRLAAGLRLVPHGTGPRTAREWYSPRAEITHRIGVRRLGRTKRQALACHASQATGGEAMRTVQLLTRLPMPVFALVAGTEWFVEHGAEPPRRPLRDPFRPATRAAS